MRRGPISKRITPLITKPCDFVILCGINLPFGRLFPSLRQVAHVLLTRPPLIRSPKGTSSLDLHVLGTPPAFVLSQDQTLNLKFNLKLKFTDFMIYHHHLCLIFKDQFFSVASSDFYIVSFFLILVNTFLNFTFNLKAYFMLSCFVVFQRRVL